MRSIGDVEAGRVSVATMALLAAGVGLPGVAIADPSTFNDQGYSTCTATTAPTLGQDFDGVVTSCCVQNAGLPTPTAYGMACANGVANQAVDFRPTIVLPTRPRATDDAGLLLGDLDGTDAPPLPDGPTIVGSPFDGLGPPPP
jgi:hypothetical protein